MGDPTVYTDPCAPGAPQPGDLVVVVRLYRGGVMVNQLATISRVCGHVADPAPWLVAGLRPLNCWAHSIRRPTEAELATWALAQHGGAHG